MEGDDRKRPHSSPEDYPRPKTSRSDRGESRREDQDEDRSRSSERGGRDREGSSSSSSRSRGGDDYSSSRRSPGGNGGGYREGYQSFGRGGHQLQPPVIRIARTREEPGAGGSEERSRDTSADRRFDRSSGFGSSSRERSHNEPFEHRSRGGNGDRSSGGNGDRSSIGDRPSGGNGDRPDSFPGSRSGESSSRDRDRSHHQSRQLSRESRDPPGVSPSLSSSDPHSTTSRDRSRSLSSHGNEGSPSGGVRNIPEGSSWGGSNLSSGGGGNAQSRLRNLAAPEHSTVDLNDPTQKQARPGGGRRGARPPRPTDAELADFVRTRPEHVKSNKTARQNTSVFGKFCVPVDLVTNHFELRCNRWAIFHYHVDFPPEIDRTFEKRALFRPHSSNFRFWHTFDGSALYTAQRIPDNMLDLYSARGTSEEKILIKIKKDPHILLEDDPVNIQVQNIVVRQCMRALKLNELGRLFYNSREKTAFHQHNLEIWPGYKTAIRQYERKMMLCVDLTNKVLRKETAGDVIRGHRGDRARVTEELLGCIVMTNYNDRTYRIDDINWDESPRTTFSFKGTDVSFAEYYQSKYGLRIRNEDQPILYSRAKKKDVRKGMTGNIALIPEFCLMTGLTNAQRANFNLMRDLSKCLQMSPSDRIRHIQKFSNLMVENEVDQKVLNPAGLALERDFVRVPGHKFRPEEIFLGGNFKASPEGTGHRPYPKYDWSQDVVGRSMFKTVDLKYWVVIAPQQGNNLESFVHLLQRQADKMGFKIHSNCIKLQASANRGQQIRDYLRHIDEQMGQYKDKIQMIMCILPRGDKSSEEQLYGEIKRKCYLDYGVSSQCVLEKNISSGGGAKANKLPGVASKLAIQMNAKLGGIPWKVQCPKMSWMVVGFNISSVGKMRGSNSKSSSGALVASLDPEFTKYFSCVVGQESGQMLSTLLGSKMCQALHAYSKANDNKLPDRIIFYRDGMSDGQLQGVVNTEVEEMKQTFIQVYGSAGRDAPKFAFIVVNKRISTKFFVPNNQNRSYENPGPGTVVDDVVTMPERYDFYLISVKGHQGSVSPISYNVIYDTSALEPIRIQQLTFKLCHLYFNWTSTVSVPAPCQYAHKLAYLQNIMNKTGRRGETSSEPKAQLCNTLYYL